MKKTSLVITILALGLCFISGSGANAQKTLRRAVPVTTTIEGNGVIQDPTIFNYRIQSDQFGPYRDGLDSVVSQLQTGGDWQLDALASPIRSVLLDFRDSVPNSNPSPPFSVGQLPVKVETKSYLLYGNGKVSGMTGLNSTLITPLLLRFDLNGNTYRIWMNSQNYPATNYAVVTCTGVVDPNSPSTSQCNQWRIDPSVTQPDGQRKNIAKLVRFYTSKGKTIEEDHGNFYVAFSIVFTNP
ncbi:MAG: hypothetical protein ACR2H4_09755 [Pyrinomonadaceae bacterium]